MQKNDFGHPVAAGRGGTSVRAAFAPPRRCARPSMQQPERAASPVNRSRSFRTVNWRRRQGRAALLVSSGRGIPLSGRGGRSLATPSAGQPIAVALSARAAHVLAAAVTLPAAAAAAAAALSSPSCSPALLP